MSQSEYCEGCHRSDHSEHAVLCAECVDRAAQYEMLSRDKRFLYHGVCAMQSPLLDAQSEIQRLSIGVSPMIAEQLSSVLLNVSICIGRVDVMVEDCKPVNTEKEGKIGPN